MFQTRAVIPYTFTIVRGGGLRSLTSRGQTPHPISTIFDRLRERTIDHMLTENEDAALKTVDARLLTDRQTDTHIPDGQL